MYKHVKPTTYVHQTVKKNPRENLNIDKYESL